MGVLRAILAVAVMLWHGGGVGGYTIIRADVAVQLFYIISGFLITFIINHRYTGLAAIPAFYASRYLRIIVPYLVVLLFTVLYHAMIYKFYGWGGFGDYILRWSSLKSWTIIYLIFSNMTIFGIDFSVLLNIDPQGTLSFTPELNAPDLSPLNFTFVFPAWSLGVELAFYILAPFIVRARLGWTVGLITTSLVGRMVAYGYGFRAESWCYRFFPFEIAMFLAGSLSYRLWALGGPISARWRMLGSTVLLSAVVLFSWYDDAPPVFFAWPRCALYLTVAALLPLLFATTRHSSLDRFLGDLSYPIYLIHGPLYHVMGTAAVLWPGLIGGPMTKLIVVVVLTVPLAVLLTVFIERPIDRVRHRILARKARAPSRLMPDTDASVIPVAHEHNR